MATLDALIKLRFSTKILAQLTRDDGVTATVNQDVLDGSYEDAEGEFNRVVGQAFDTSIKAHVAAVISGVLYFLELYKGRDSNLLQRHKETFYAGLDAFRKLRLINPITNSRLKVSVETLDNKPDMDREGVLQGLKINENSYYRIRSFSPENDQ